MSLLVIVISGDGELVSSLAWVICDCQAVDPIT